MESPFSPVPPPRVVVWFIDEIADAIGAPVIDGVTCAVKLAEAMVSVRLATSKRGDWARPLPKAYAGMLAPYALN